MKAIIKDLEFVCVEEREGKNGKYWLYNFLDNGRLTPSIYSKEYFVTEGVKKCEADVQIGSYNGNLNMKLVGINAVK